MSEQVEVSPQQFAECVVDNLTQLIEAASSLNAECERLRSRLEALEALHGIDIEGREHTAITKTVPAAEEKKSDSKICPLCLGEEGDNHDPRCPFGTVESENKDA